MLSSTLGKPPLIQDGLVKVLLPSDRDEHNQDVAKSSFSTQMGHDPAFWELFTESM